MINFLDLFSGIGGFALGAEWAGVPIKNHFYSEVDEYAIKVYKKRFPDAEAIGDIARANWWHIKKSVSGDWLVAGGFPCQDISLAGAGAGITGSRSGLWTDMLTCIGILRPKFAVIENVPALTTRGLDRMLAGLASIGYDAEGHNIPAHTVGADHERQRAWIIGYPEGNGRERVLCGDLATSACRISKTWSNDALDSQRSPFLRFEERVGEPAIFGVAPGIPRQVDRLRCLGNSIIPEIAEIIFRRILRLE